MGRWVEIDAELGGSLWAVYRVEMIRRCRYSAVHVHETLSDPEGDFGIPKMLTVIGLRGGGPLLKIITTWDRIEGSPRLTRYWLYSSTEDQDDHAT